MIRYLKHEEIDKLKWDKCIRDSFNGNIYGWSWYLDIVHQNWEALVEDDYIRIFPLTGNVRVGIHYLFQPFFAQQLGIFSRNILNAEIIGDFLTAIPKQFKLIQIRLNTHNKLDNQPFEHLIHRNFELDLIPTYDRLQRNYSTNTKRNLKKADEAKLMLMRNIRPEDVVEMFRKNRGRTISQWNDREYQRLIKLVYAGIYRGQAKLYGAYTHDNELVAGAIFMKSHGKLVFLFSGTSSLGRDNHALSFILDQVIREYASGPLVLDFEGSDNDNLARFYKGFGSKETGYPGITINRLPLVVRIAMKIIHLRKKL